MTYKRTIRERLTSTAIIIVAAFLLGLSVSAQCGCGWEDPGPDPALRGLPRLFDCGSGAAIIGTGRAFRFTVGKQAARCTVWFDPEWRARPSCVVSCEDCEQTTRTRSEELPPEPDDPKYLVYDVSKHSIDLHGNLRALATYDASCLDRQR